MANDDHRMYKAQQLPSPNCLMMQAEINAKMRRILIDWLVDVHLKFKLLPETLFITINLIDRYSRFVQIKRKYYQLIGVSCMLIASKYEEIYPPHVKDLVYITDSAYTRDQIVECEYQILEVLDFQIMFPTSFRFLERYSHISECEAQVFHLA